ncbi:MAG TPA: hypothetical protein PLI47_11445, partial [Bacteroidia bacterium]|nr:hypothetical protein [Bacteroidia bacterium]
GLSKSVGKWEKILLKAKFSPTPQQNNNGQLSFRRNLLGYKATHYSILTFILEESYRFKCLLQHEQWGR